MTNLSIETVPASIKRQKAHHYDFFQDLARELSDFLLKELTKD